MLAYALSWRFELISLLNAKLMNFVMLKGQYVDDPYFASIYVEYAMGAQWIFKIGTLCSLWPC